MNRDWHNEPHHVNAAVRDQDSDVTGRGRHNRLVVFGGTGEDRDLVTVREDVIPGREYPEAVTVDLARRHACTSWQRMHPRGTRLVHVGSSEPYPSGAATWTSVDHVFRIVRGRAI